MSKIVVKYRSPSLLKTLNKLEGGDKGENVQPSDNSVAED